MAVIVVREKHGFAVESAINPGLTFVDSMWFCLEAIGPMSRVEAKKFLSEKDFFAPPLADYEEALPWRDKEKKRAWIIPLRLPP